MTTRGSSKTMTPFPKMTPALQAYLSFDPNKDEGGYKESRRLQELVEPGLYREYHRMEIDADFVPENEQAEGRAEVVSPSGKYKLVLVNYAVEAGFGRRQGRVYRQGQEAPLTLVNRNYVSFPHLFIEGHPNGHSYLVCGEDYQGQTVIELDTGRRLDFLPEDADKGWGFCSASFAFDAGTGLLVVDGCIWACPYEFRFYDFSDPMAGWPELDTGEEMIDADELPPVFAPDGTILTHQTAEGEEPRAVVATKVFRREGPKLVLVREDVTPAEAERREAAHKAQEAYDAWWAGYKAEDPLYLASRALMKEPPFTASDHDSIGQTHDQWCAHWKGKEKRICRRIHQGKKPGQGYTFDLEIAHLSGPVKLDIYKDGKTQEPAFFEHSVQGVEQAFAHARDLLAAEATP